MDAWNDGRVIIPAGTEVHGIAQKSPVREHIGSDRQWFLRLPDGRELPISGTVLDRAPNPKNSSSSARKSDDPLALRRIIVKSDQYAEAKAILAAMISAGAGAFPETTNLLPPLGGATQLNNGGIRKRLFRGSAGCRTTLPETSLERLEKTPFYVRVPSAATFPSAGADARSGHSHRRPLRVHSPPCYSTNDEQINAQQKAHTEALLEQNRAMKERIDALQKNESTIQNLQSEVERPRKELDCRKESAPTEADNASSDFSLWRAEPDRAEDEISDPGEIVLFPGRKPTARHSSFLKWRLNDELTEALDALERRKLLNLLFPSRTFLALTSHNAP